MTCRACNQPHPSSMRCEVWARQNPVVVNTDVVVNKPESVVVNKRSLDRHKPRNEYMREYMRKRRGRD